jgi:hypothetical protein
MTNLVGDNVFILIQSTTFVKHFIVKAILYDRSDYKINLFVGWIL